MSSVALVTSPLNEEHRYPGHPERPERLAAIEARLEKSGLWRDCLAIQATAATHEDVLRVHDRALLDNLAATRGKSGGFDPDTYYTPQTYEAAMLAAGAAIEGVRAVMGGRVNRAIALVRPPGHHATPVQAMGFCHLNNVAIAARFAQATYGIEEVAIVDFDVHHGNGTQDIFYEDPSVFFLSLHQHPLWPMSGLAHECGTGRGINATLNVPVPAYTNGAKYISLYEQALDRVFQFKPQLLLISAGFDAHRLDPLAGLNLETQDFEKLTDSLVRRCEAAGVRGIVSCLEGGYHLQALAESAEAHIRALME